MDVVINLNTPSHHTHCQIPSSLFYQHMLTCLGYKINELPVANLLSHYHGLPGEWVVASPIHWNASHNDCMLDPLTLTEEVSRTWFNVLTDFVQYDGMKTHYHDANTWLIRIDDQPSIYAKPPEMLLHQSIKGELKSLDPTFFWQKFLTESQMLFSAHALNQGLVNQCSLNGVWIWGCGKLYKTAHPIICDVNLMELAKSLSTHIHEYSVKAPISSDTLFLFNEMTEDKQSALERQLRKKTSHWHWNNRTYVRQAIPFIKRIWS